ncbi:MAG TPA: DUF1501 domain-containing protein [Verrucomicrobiae bacterium]|nr:DUF1501 domain-containing protein [Verrucomicrobiae bacterium]
MTPLNIDLTRRTFLQRAGAGIGLAALGVLSNPRLLAQGPAAAPAKPYLLGAAKAKRIIYLHQSGAPSHLDLFAYKPKLNELRGQELPDSVRQGQRLTGMTADYDRHSIFPSPFQFARHGQSGQWFSELWPNLSKQADEICCIHTMQTEAINHDPAITFVHTGSQIAGRPSFGSWIAYGLGSDNQDLPAFVVLLSNGTGRPDDQPLYDRLWSAGFLPSQYQGVRLRGQGEPVLFLSNPPGVDAGTRRAMLDGVRELNQAGFALAGDPEIQTRITQYEMAFRMQSSVPDLADLSKEPPHIFELYGPESRKPGTFAANCLLARRLAERNVRFIQLYHKGWDQHFNLARQIKGQCYDVDQPCAALISDLKQRGLLDETLIVWGGEFGRTVYAQGDIDSPRIGRDHHPKCFTVWLAGGGIRGGTSYGQTDDFAYNVVENPVTFFDLNATLLQLLGIDHTRLILKYQGRDYRLTDVHGEIVKGIVA